MAEVQLGDITVDVVFKDIKNVHLSVCPPDGKVKIAAPIRMNLDTIRVYAISKLAWIKQQQRKLREQARETPREYLNLESHYVWGQRYLLSIAYSENAVGVFLKHRKIVLRLPPDSDQEKKQIMLEAWYREILKQAAQPLIAKWASVLGVTVSKVFVQRMKTKWGSCNPKAQSIRLNSELAKKAPACLEYIVLHEMMHLLERHHNDRFMALMDSHMPNWRSQRDELNRAPLGYENWGAL
ncbi:M48 family metallopeptidase [Methylicorpusculum sp.]|uniref:M48 family metallopeptidase n=1 Tax=Methylicorpusculum sp. TaxID=2713644 RepID=UPI0027254DEE|nr:SprT family zinc-dependent metalloprotease [Methylicorpusculum sp.]MDO8843441.1 SprT family zinc-dependent metalloprotease [Methylicorpusculum sp.]